jgi:pimeloyl-ACP methyl ester carboxylesterase
MPEVNHGPFTTFYAEAGDQEAPAVVLLHGFTSDNRMWLPVAGALSEDYRVIAPDLRGHGGSTAPEDLDSYTMEAYADDIARLLDTLEIDVCALVGCSFGGMVALQFATAYPERLAGLVLSDSSAAYDHPEYDDRYRAREARIDENASIVERFGTEELGKRAARDIADPFLAEGLRKRYSRMSSEGFLGAARARKERPNLLPLLKERITVPTLVCIGDEDPVLSACDVMVRELPQARYVIFKGSGHGIPSLKPESYCREVLQFLSDIEEDRPVAGKRTVV